MKWMIEFQSWIEVFMVLLPWILTILFTQILKIFVYQKLVNWLRLTLCLATPLLLSGIFFFISMMPDLEIWGYIQNMLGAWLLAIGGFSVTKGISKIIKGIIEYLKKE